MYAQFRTLSLTPSPFDCRMSTNGRSWNSGSGRDLAPRKQEPPGSESLVYAA
jgi:hypothetical protein